MVSPSPAWRGRSVVVARLFPSLPKKTAALPSRRVYFGPTWPEVPSAYKEPAQSGFPAVQHSGQRTGHRLQAIRRKQESKEQEHEPAQRCRCEKEAYPEGSDNNRGNRQDEGAEVKEEPAQGSQQGKDKGKGTAITFNIIFIMETSFLSFYLHFTMSAWGHKCCE